DCKQILLFDRRQAVEVRLSDLRPRFGNETWIVFDPDGLASMDPGSGEDDAAVPAAEVVDHVVLAEVRRLDHLLDHIVRGRDVGSVGALSDDGRRLRRGESRVGRRRLPHGRGLFVAGPAEIVAAQYRIVADVEPAADDDGMENGLPVGSLEREATFLAKLLRGRFDERDLSPFAEN